MGSDASELIQIGSVIGMTDGTQGNVALAYGYPVWERDEPDPLDARHRTLYT